MVEKKEFKSEQDAIQFLITDDVILTLRKISSEENGHKVLLEDIKKKCGLGDNEKNEAMKLFGVEEDK